MKKGYLILTLGILSFISSFGQITKNNWMVGGNGMISFSNQTGSSASAKGQYITVSPNIGYFFIDKMAGGIRSKYGFSKVTSGPIVAKSSRFNIGPFVRYYFLDKANRVNCFADAAFQFGKSWGNNNAPSENDQNFTISAGPVIYFNSSVGLEFAINYGMDRGKIDDPKVNTLFFTLGFQIHLEKERNN
mgnify:CR=1 FL=1